MKSKSTAPLPSGTLPGEVKQIDFAKPPPPSGGDAIEFGPLTGKVIAVKIIDRIKQTTKFGVKDMSTGFVVALGSKEPLGGVMFQSYFQRLELDRWYIGRVIQHETRVGKAWVLDSDDIAPADVAKLSELINTLESSDNPF